MAERFLLYECSGKYPHQTYSAAEKVARKSKRRKARQNVNLKIYRCRFCRRWHIGSAPKHAKH